MCTTLEAKIRRGIEEYEQGKVHKMEEGEKDLKELMSTDLCIVSMMKLLKF